MCRIVAICIVLVLLVTLPARAEEPAPGWLDNWPHWRGPECNGSAPRADPPVVWDLSKNLKWKTPLSGRGSSTPIVWGDQVFILTAVPTDRVATATDIPKPDPRFEKKTTPPACYYQFLVLSFDRQTGKLRWQHTATQRVPHEGHHPTTSYAAGSPATDGQRLYVSFGSFGTYCYDLNGRLLWQRDLGRMNTRLGWGEAVTPVVHGDSLLLNWDQEADSALYCLDARTGKTHWKVERDERNTSWNTPFVVENKGRTQVIVNGTKRARSYDLANGKEFWACGGMTLNAIPSPVCDRQTAYLMSGYGGSAARAIALDASGDVTDTEKVLWKLGRGTPYVPSPLLANGRLWFTQANQGLLTTLDIATGRPILDRVRLNGLTSLYASPVAAAGRVYLLGRDGTMLVLRQSDQLEVLATNHLDDEFDASPAAVGKELFLRGEKFVYCLSENEKAGPLSNSDAKPNAGTGRESTQK
jgi:outer membrane protein assembly factor BamB